MTELLTQMTLWIVCPVYYDIPSFEKLHHQVADYLETFEEIAPAKIIFVAVDDSAGQDQQVREVEKIPKITVIRPPFNIGHQRAIVFGLRKLSARVRENDIILTMDADGEDRPQDVPKLIKELITERQKNKVVLAKRTSRRKSWQFNCCYFFFKIFFKLLTGKVIKTGNFCCFYGSLLREIIFHPYFDLCYSSSLINLNLPNKFVPCARGHRFAGHSKMSASALVMHGIRMLMPFLDKIAVRSLIVFGITFVIGLLLSLIVAAGKYFTSLAIPDWATYTMLLTLNLSFIALGNFLILFSIFSQIQGSALTYLDKSFGEIRE